MKKKVNIIMICYNKIEFILGYLITNYGKKYIFYSSIIFPKNILTHKISNKIKKLMDHYQ